MTVQNRVLYNNAAAGFLSGMLAKRLYILETNYNPIQPIDFAGVVTAAFTFASEVDTVLQNWPTMLPPPVGELTGESGTNVPGNFGQANAAESLPAAMVFICKAAWQERSNIPIDSSSQQPFTAAQYQSVANYVVSEFLEYCAGTDNA